VNKTLSKKKRIVDCVQLRKMGSEKVDPVGIVEFVASKT
jgi:hypothetical protein